MPFSPELAPPFLKPRARAVLELDDRYEDDWKHLLFAVCTASEGGAPLSLLPRSSPTLRADENDKPLRCVDSTLLRDIKRGIKNDRHRSRSRVADGEPGEESRKALFRNVKAGSTLAALHKRDECRVRPRRCLAGEDLDFIEGRTVAR